MSKFSLNLFKHWNTSFWTWRLVKETVSYIWEYKTSQMLPRNWEDRRNLCLQGRVVKCKLVIENFPVYNQPNKCWSCRLVKCRSLPVWTKNTFLLCIRKSPSLTKSACSKHWQKRLIEKKKKKRRKTCPKNSSCTASLSNRWEKYTLIFWDLTPQDVSAVLVSNEEMLKWDRKKGQSFQSNPKSFELLSFFDGFLL